MRRIRRGHVLLAAAAAALCVPASGVSSGSAVPTAARTLPTAPSARFSLWPNHSMPLVKSSAATRMTTRPRASSMSSKRERYARRCSGAYGRSAT